jgi:hypothetical protein
LQVQGGQDRLSELAGKKVTVTGDLRNNVIALSTVSPAQ